MGGGPYDAAALGPGFTPPAGVVDFGTLRVPVPVGGVVELEPPAGGPPQAVHVSVGEGRLSVSALAAPKTGRVWPDLATELDTSLRESGARVRSYPGAWGRELHATTGAATSVFIGVDGPRWMVYGVATGPTRDAAALEARLRRMLTGTVVVRGRSPYPVRTVLPLAAPSEVATPAGGAGSRSDDRAAGRIGSPSWPPPRLHRPGSSDGAHGVGPHSDGAHGVGPHSDGAHGVGAGSSSPDREESAATAAFSAVVRAARPGPEMSGGATSTGLPAHAPPPVPPRPVPGGPGSSVRNASTAPPRLSSPAASRTGGRGVPPAPWHRSAAGPRPSVRASGVGPSFAGPPLPADGPGPTGEDLFTPSSTAPPRVGPDRLDVAPASTNPTPTGRHVRPEPPVWRWPADRGPADPHPAVGRRRMPEPPAGQGRHADPDRAANHPERAATNDAVRPAPSPPGAGRHHRPDH